MFASWVKLLLPGWACCTPGWIAAFLVKLFLFMLICWLSGKIDAFQVKLLFPELNCSGSAQWHSGSVLVSWSCGLGSNPATSRCVWVFTPQLNDPLHLIKGVWRCRCVASLLFGSFCLLSEFRCQMGLIACNKDTYYILHYFYYYYYKCCFYVKLLCFG